MSVSTLHLSCKCRFRVVEVLSKVKTMLIENMVWIPALYVIVSDCAHKFFVFSYLYFQHEYLCYEVLVHNFKKV